MVVEVGSGHRRLPTTYPRHTFFPFFLGLAFCFLVHTHIPMYARCTHARGTGDTPELGMRMSTRFVVPSDASWLWLERLGLGYPADLDAYDMILLSYYFTVLLHYSITVLRAQVTLRLDSIGFVDSHMLT